MPKAPPSDNETQSIDKIDSIAERTQRLVELINDKAITRSSDDVNITSPTGFNQSWLIDLRPLLLTNEGLDLITDLFWDLFEDKLPFQVGGMEVAAVPIVTAILMKAKERGLTTNGFIIRKERKATGLGKRIEGEINQDPIVLVDDIINSGNSMEKSRVALEQAGHRIKDIFVIIHYQSQAALQWLTTHKINLHHLTIIDQYDVVMHRPEWKPPTIEYEVKWRFIEKGAFPFHVVPKSTPLLVGDKIYMGTEAGIMVCLDRHTGGPVWKYDVKTHHTKGIWSSPAHHNGRIYFGAYNGIAYCLDAETGEEVWKNPCCEFIGSSPLIVPEHNMMYLGLEHQRPRQMGSNAAFDLDTGARIWERPQKKYQHGSAAYYKAKDYVIWGNADHDVTAYDAKTGEIIWKHDTIRSIKYPPVIDEQRKLVVATSFDGNIYCLDADTGERKAAIQTNDICYTTPLITFGKIFAGSGDRHLYIIDAYSFEVIKKMDCHARVYSSPKLIDGRVIVGSAGGRIAEIHPDTLEIIEHTQLPDAITNAICASEDSEYLYASTIMNEVYAIKRTKLD